MPDHLANQIAAGEVIQRPASAVKELLENALDAGATEIQLIIKDAGKELIQVVDNGCGMNPIDARMSFERHATSKIKSIEDLFSIKTMGFRGEALASMAAVAQIELKTRPQSEEIGTLLQIEASEVKKQEAVACPVGTNFAIRNLFYNVPARRKFLKSNTSEYKHIVEEFTRVAMAFPEICFRLYHNQTEQFYLKSGNLKSRIIDLLGSRTEQKLIPVSEDAELVQLEGFVGKPSAATKSRGNQFFFVNNRFIRSPYLNHAVVKAFEGLIDKDTYPLYVLRLTLDTERVDVNVHPSKQEVKFDDDQMLYAYLHAAVKHSLARFNVAPSLDFTLDAEIQNSDAVRLPLTEERRKEAGSGFLAHSFSEKGRAHFRETQQERVAWSRQQKAFFPPMPDIGNKKPEAVVSQTLPEDMFADSEGVRSQTTAETAIQWGAFMATTVKSGILLVHKRRARERIIFESLQHRMQHPAVASQQLLFPFEMEILPAHLILVKEALPFLKAIGFEACTEKNHQLIVSGLPPGMSETSGRKALSELTEQIVNSPLMLKDPMKAKLLAGMASSLAHSNEEEGMNDGSLIDELFACSEPQLSPAGKKVFTILSAEKLNSLL